MTEKEYRNHPAISRSELWRMHESPEKFKWYKDNPPPPTKELLFGQVVHKLLLQPETFSDEFAIAPNVDRRTKSGKAIYDEFVENAGDRTIVPDDLFQTAAEMVQKARSSPLVLNLLGGEKEVPLFWTDSDTGEECKCRVDVLPMIDGKFVVVDYKTTTNARTDIFNNSIFRYGYHFQSGMYTEGVMKSLGLTYRPEFFAIAQEKTPPYSLNVIAFPEEVVLAGTDCFREYIGTYHACKEMGIFYGYNGAFDEPNEAFLPGWMQLGVEAEDE